VNLRQNQVNSLDYCLIDLYNLIIVTSFEMLKAFKSLYSKDNTTSTNKEDSEESRVAKAFKSLYSKEKSSSFVNEDDSMQEGEDLRGESTGEMI
jgi:hypothetical protein